MEPGLGQAENGLPGWSWSWGLCVPKPGYFPEGRGNKHRAPHWFRLPNRRPRGRVGWGCLGRLIRGEMSRSFFARFLFSMFFRAEGKSRRAGGLGWRCVG